MVAVSTLIIGAVALIGGGLFTSSLVSSLATPLALILAGVAGGASMIRLIRSKELGQFFTSDTGEFLAGGLIGATVFFLVFVAAQSLITGLSPLAGLIVVGLGVAVFFAGPGILLDLLEVVVSLFSDE